MSWVVEITKDLKGKHPGKYIACFMRYITDDEAEKLLGNRYDNYSHLNPQYEHLSSEALAQLNEPGYVKTECSTGCEVPEEVVEVVNTTEEQSTTTEDIFSLLNIK
jgi:predicted nucleotidyltransferase